MSKEENRTKAVDRLESASSSDMYESLSSLNEPLKSLFEDVEAAYRRLIAAFENSSDFYGVFPHLENFIITQRRLSLETYKLEWKLISILEQTPGQTYHLVISGHTTAANIADSLATEAADGLGRGSSNDVYESRCYILEPLKPVLDDIKEAHKLVTAALESKSDYYTVLSYVKNLSEKQLLGSVETTKFEENLLLIIRQGVEALRADSSASGLLTTASIEDTPAASGEFSAASVEDSPSISVEATDVSVEDTSVEASLAT